MSDLESRLAATLRDGANDAPAVAGLASAARARARQRRRTRVGGVAAAVVLAIAVPAGVAAWPHSAGDDGGGRDVADAGPDAPWTDGGHRWESWHGVTVEVPDEWVNGDQASWCAGDGLATTFRVTRIGGASPAVNCSPAFSYGLSFQGVEDGEPFDWPVVTQSGQAWPADTFVGAHAEDGVLVTVAGPDREDLLAVLDSVEAIGPEGDPNGCTSSRGEARPDVPEGSMAICRYDGQGLLEQSERLTGEDADRATAALDAAPADEINCFSPADEVVEVVRMRSTDLHANVELGGTCPGIRGLEGDRRLTSDVLYWALSPGWSRAVDGGVPLPGALRQR